MPSPGNVWGRYGYGREFEKSTGTGNDFVQTSSAKLRPSPEIGRRHGGKGSGDEPLRGRHHGEKGWTGASLM
jgi:hypothetical protein